MTQVSHTDILVVGAGLSGLHLTGLLFASGLDVQLVEARDRLGGRILNGASEDAKLDLGPAWFWPGQPRIAALSEQFELKTFQQYAAGDARFEDRTGQIQQGRGIGSMQGSLRIAGGLGALIEALSAQVPSNRMRRSAPVTALTNTGSLIEAECADGSRFSAQTVVLALPPRLAAQLAYAPALPFNAVRAMRNVPTWMAGQAKVVLVYDTPFWRTSGLSGDAMSQIGPMVEIHDASPFDSPLGALFGFIGVPPAHRRDTALLERAIRAQAVRLFGQGAATPRAVIVQDWATEVFTATDDDLAPMSAHPHYGLPPELRDLWGGRLVLSGTEVAPTFGGYLEGALEAAELVFDQINGQQPQRMQS